MLSIGKTMWKTAEHAHTNTNSLCVHGSTLLCSGKALLERLKMDFSESPPSRSVPNIFHIDKYIHVYSSALVSDLIFSGTGCCVPSRLQLNLK